MNILLILGLTILPIFNIILAVGTYKGLGKPDIKQRKLMHTLYNIIVIISYAILTVLLGYVLILTSGKLGIAKEVLISFSIFIINIFIYIISKILLIVGNKRLKEKVG